jgi:enoyl-CoA hydratase
MSKVLTEVRGKSFVITINRPEKKNCVDGETARLLHEAWLRFRDDEELWVAILTGAGPESFCSGADLSDLDGLGPPRDAPAAVQRQFVTHGTGYLGYTRQVDIYKPIVCAVNGYALAGGLELACLGDLRIVEEHAELGVACRRWNVPLVDGGTQRLPRIVGLGHAMDLILTGRSIGAAEAYRMGLANQVVPKGDALRAALSLADALAKLPQGAMRSDKQAAVMGMGRTLEEGLRIEAELGQWAIRSADIHEGSRAFLEKRAASFAQDDAKSSPKKS